jgi:type IV pilus assembly protein PilP
MRTIVLSLAVTMGLVACDSPPPPPAPKQPPPAPKAAEPAKVDSAAKPVDSAAAPYAYSYNPVGKLDPFHNPIDDLVATSNGATTTTTSSCNQPLCRWDLDQLKLVGIVSGMANPVAMMEDPQGIGHFVRRNSFVGKRGGRVTQIKRDEVVVTEIFKGPDGKPHPNNIDMKISGVANDTIEATDLLEGDVGE